MTYPEIDPTRHVAKGVRILAKVRRWPEAVVWPRNTDLVELESDGSGNWLAVDEDPSAPFGVPPSLAGYIDLIAPIPSTLPATPVVELPETPTLGVVTAFGGVVAIGEWHTYNDRSGNRWLIAPEREFLPESVTAFTPATAVPTEALDELRAEVTKRLGCASIECKSLTMAKTFLAAVNEANS